MRSRKLAAIILAMLLSTTLLYLMYQQYFVEISAVKVNVAFLSHYLAPDSAAFRGLIEKWNPSFRKMGFYVEVLDVDKESILPLLLSSSNSSIDVVVVTSFNFRRLLPYLTPLKGLPNLERFYEKALNAFYENGSLYAVPFHASFPVLFYNRNHIATPPNSFTQLIELAENFSKSRNPLSPTEYGLAIYSLEGRHSSLVFQSLYETLGGQVVSSSSNIKFVSNKTLERLLHVYSSLAEEGVSPAGIQYFESSTLNEAFARSDFPMMIQWNYALHALSEGFTLDNVGIAPIPSDSGSSTSVGYLLAFGICRGSGNQKYSIKFLEAVQEIEFIKGLVGIGAFPPVKGVSTLLEDKILEAEEKIFSENYENCLLQIGSSNFYDTVSKCLEWYLEKRISETEFINLISNIT